MSLRSVVYDDCSLCSLCRVVCIYLVDVWQSILTVLAEEQFSTVTFNQQAPVSLQTSHAKTTNTTVITHCIFRHSSGHAIHLVIFYQRGYGQFLWHGSLPDVRHLDLTEASVKFGRHEGAYNR